jgi:spoIIIJ-associated protein
MEKFITATGKTIDLAVNAALAELHLDRDSVSVEVLENPKSGFLGIGASPAKVKVTYEAPDEAPAPALSSASRSPKKPWKPASEVKKEAEQAAAKAPEKKAEKKSEPVRPAAPKPAVPRTEEPPVPEQKVAKPVVHYAPAAPGSTEEQIETFIKGLLEHMGSDAVPHAAASDDGYRVELVGNSLGMLIGRRGETLDAIQHLTNYAVNHGSAKRIRITVDAENYRAKREEALVRLAYKVAGKVVRYRRNMTLEPMNAYERHVIHAALQDYADVTTYSTGTEPNRRIVVAYSKYHSTPTEE